MEAGVRETRRSDDPSTAAARFVDRGRLWQRHMEMAKIGAIPGDGVNRQALTREDIAARKLLIGWAEGLGFSIAMDAIGNLFIRRNGRNPDAPPVLTGSHMDSQPSGGRFDGIYGVLAGLEALEAFDEADAVTERPIEVVVWTNEEGGRFSPGAMGSMVFTESRRLEDCLGIADAQGVLFADALAETLAATPGTEKRPFNFPVAAYIETHIGVRGATDWGGHRDSRLALVRGRGCRRERSCWNHTAEVPARCVTRGAGNHLGSQRPHE